jgi:DNA repair protein RecN (Recombination protein N)
VEYAHFDFHSGFTCITGETGSGKTSLLEALKLTLGKKSDFDLIKKGSQKAEVTAVFELENTHPIYSHLDSHDISLQKGEPLIIKRILLQEGKSKAFLNQQMVSVHLLQTLLPFLCEFVDQNDLLKSQGPYFFHDLIDKLGGLKQELIDYQKAFSCVKDLEAHILNLEKKADNKDFRLKLLKEDIDDLLSAHIEKGEEAQCFEQYKECQKKSEALSGYQKALELINLDLLPKMKKLQKDKYFEDFQLETLNTAYIAFCDLSLSIETKVLDQNLDEQKLQKLEERLKLIHSLKRKYHIDADCFAELLEKKQQEYDELIFLEDVIHEAKTRQVALNIELQDKATKLNHKRQLFSPILAKNLVAHLKPLNMPFVDLEFVFLETSYHEKGHTKIDLHIQTNASSPKICWLEGASGGELARINFAFFLETSPLSAADCYFFDEIDAHVGGMTSSLMGEKLKALSESKQVFCVTHFPQMALKASNHLAFMKNQDTHGTKIHTHYSSQAPLCFEIDRMVGVKS